MQEYVLPQDIPIDPVETLNQLTGRFRSVRDGLPELIKNSKDQYSRLGIDDKQRRQIVVVSNTAHRTLAVLDFAGAPARNFEGWTNWSDPTAGQTHLAADIEAGHGNGGKAFMVRGASASAFLESCHAGKRTRKGFINDNPAHRYKPGFGITDGTTLDNVDESNPTRRLQEALSLVGMRMDLLPESAKEAFASRQSFTIAYLEKVQDWIGRRRPKLRALAGPELADIIASHGQTAMSIETCDVWIVQDGKVIDAGPVKPVELAPYPGFEEPRHFDIPHRLLDQETGETIRISDHSGAAGFLRLCTSRNQLQISQNTRAKNVIRIWNHRNNVATWTPQELHGVSASSFIYGEMRCPSLTSEHLDGATRLHLADTPLARALRQWATGHVKQLADDLHQAMAARTTPRERKRANSTLRNIRKLMRKYLDADSIGTGISDATNGTGSGENGNGQTQPRKPIKYGKQVHEIHLEPNLRDVMLIAGTKIPLLFRCLEHLDGGIKRPVRAKPLVLKSEPPGMFTLDEDALLSAHSAGIGEIWLETPDGTVTSNRREFWSMHATDVDLEVPSEPLLQGQRLKLNITFQTPHGPIDDALINGEVEDPSFGSIGRHGRFTAAHKEGSACVRIRYGPSSSDYRDFSIPVGPDRVPPREGTGDTGSDVPEILLCGDIAPGTADYPPERQTIPGGPEYPTIIEDPLFPSIVWINHYSKEATRVRRGAGGSSGLGKITSRTFLHFVALKCFEILKRLRIRQQIAQDYVTEYMYMQYAAQAEMDCAGFIDDAWELTDHLMSSSRT